MPVWVQLASLLQLMALYHSSAVEPLQPTKHRFHSKVVFFTCEMSGARLVGLCSQLHIYSISLKVLYLRCFPFVSAELFGIVHNASTSLFESLKGRRRGHVHAHQLQSLSLQHLCFSHRVVRFLDHLTHSRLVEHVGGVSLPQRRNRWVHALHSWLKRGVIALFGEVVSKGNLQALVPHDHIAEPKGKIDIFILDSDQVNDGSEDGVQAILHNALLHLAGICDWDWVRIDHTETLWEDRVAWSRAFFLSLVPDQMLLNDGIDNEAWSREIKWICHFIKLETYLMWCTFFLAALSAWISTPGEIDLPLAMLGKSVEMSKLNAPKFFT